MHVHIQHIVLAMLATVGKISNTFLFLFSKMSVFGFRINQMLVRTANKEDPG